MNKFVEKTVEQLKTIDSVSNVVIVWARVVTEEGEIIDINHQLDIDDFDAFPLDKKIKLLQTLQKKVSFIKKT